MHLNCPECQTHIISEDIHLVQTIAKCKSCNNIFEFTDQLKEAGFPTPYRHKPEIFNIPPGIDILHLMNELEIKINWRRSAKYFTPFFALVWNVFVFFHSFIMIFSSGNTSIFLFYIPFYAAGIYLMYKSLGLFLNNTYITVDVDKILVEHKPINFLIQKDQYLPSEDVDQVYVTRHEVGKRNDNPVYAWSVEVKMKDGEIISLVKELHALKYARFIEQEIEKHLDIRDRPVSGEWKH